jgi:hypothetical protein
VRPGKFSSRNNGMKKLVLGVALAILMSGCAPSTIEQCPNKQELEDQIANARKAVQRFRGGHVIVGRVVLDGKGDERDIKAQMEILPGGYFAGATKDLIRPVGFRMHQYAPFDLQLKGMKGDLVDVGTIRMKKLNEDELVDFKAQIVLEQGGDLSRASILLSDRHGPVNTPSNGTSPRRYWPSPIKIPVLKDGMASASGFSPIEYWCRVTSPGYLEKSFSIEFKAGQTFDLGTVTLERPKQIELNYIVSKKPPFDPNDLKTVRIPAGTRWKAVDDIYGWDLEFKQDKGSIVMKYSYGPCYLWDQGDGEIEEYVNTGEIATSSCSLHEWQASNGHVYLFHQAHWKRWVLFKIFIKEEYGSASDDVADKAVEASVSGRVIDEQGKPLAGVKWWVSGIEELYEGHWIVVYRTGIPQEHTTGSDGRFVLTFQKNARYDLQFDKWAFGPVFLYQISATSPEINVVMKKGVPIRGSVTRLVNGTREPASGATMVELRLPNSRGLWYSKKVFVDHQGNFECFASPPPQPLTEFLLTCNGKAFQHRSQPAKWQVVFAGEILEIDVEQEKQVDEINFEIQVKVTRGATQQPDQPDE